MSIEDFSFDLDIRQNKVYLPCSKAYTDINFSEKFTDHLYLIEMQKILNEWCSQYDDIHLKLRPGINDIRPFIWSDFVTLQRYTYVVDLNSLSIEFVENIPEFKSWSKENLTLTHRELNVNDVNFHLTFLKSKITSRKYKAIQNDLNARINELSVLELRDSNQNIKAQMIFNNNSKRAEQLFYIDDEDFKRNRGGIYAQYSFMLYFKEKGYSEFDFCGANLKNIAIYKSRFPVRLERIYELWYTKSKIKKLARQFLFHQI